MDNTFSSVIIESMSDGVLVLDFQGHITHINPAGMNLLGLGPEDVRDRTYGQLFLNAPENDAFNDILIRGIQEKESRLYREVPFKRADGRQLDLAVTTSFLRVEAGKWTTPGIVVVFKDITEFKALDRARHRVLDHLSHELMTPLSIVSSSLRTLETSENQRTLERIRRNLKRLQNIQMDVEDIVNRQDLDGDNKVGPCLDQTLDLLEVMAEENPAHAGTVKAVKKMVEEAFPQRQTQVQAVRLGPAVERVVSAAESLSTHRNVHLRIDIQEDAAVLIDEGVFEKVLMSLVKNAIENTPNEGGVEVILQSASAEATLAVRDTGVGITRESQKQIFGGFYHARETDLYSTKKPFEFGAGGKGLELLKIRIFAEAYQFRVMCESTRCEYISGEDETCPGAISKCPHVRDATGCARCGGSTFTLVFPVAANP